MVTSLSKVFTLSFILVRVIISVLEVIGVIFTYLVI